MLKTTQHKLKLEHLDTHSGHTWRYEVDVIARTVDIYKNDSRVGSLDYLPQPMTEMVLVEIREGL